MKERKYVCLVVFLFMILAFMGSMTFTYASSSTSTHTVHDYTIRGSRISAATCTSPAKYTYYCSCGKSTIKSFGSALGHNPTTKGSLKSVATCTSAAVYYYDCTRCGAKSVTTKLVGSALGHSYGSWSNYSSTQHKRTCSRCGNVDKANHNSSKTSVKSATCTEDGYEKVYCSVCNALRSSTTKTKLGHTYTKTISVTFELVSNGKTGQHRAVTVKQCLRCTATNTTKAASVSHTWNSGAVTKAATTTTTGVKTYTCTANGCGATYTEIIPKLSSTACEHPLSSRVVKTRVEKVKTASTCTRTYEWTVCGNCGLVVVNEQLKNTDSTHNYTGQSWVIGTAQHQKTCVDCGYITSQAHFDNNKDGKCDVCSYKMSSTSATNTHTSAHRTLVKSKDDAQHATYCIDCGNWISGTEKNHSFTVELSKTYEKVDSQYHRPVYVYKCAECEKTKTTKGASVTHQSSGYMKYRVYSTNPPKHTYECSLCGWSEIQDCSFGSVGICNCGNIKPATSNNNSTKPTPNPTNSNSTTTVKAPVVVDVVGKYNDKELSKPTENPTIVPIGSNIHIVGTDNVSTVQISWDDGIESATINGSNGEITVPSSFAPGTQHTLHLVATGESITSKKEYIIKIPSNIEVNATYDGKTLDNGEQVKANRGDMVIISGAPVEDIASIAYMWDNEEAVTVGGANYVITIPDTFDPGIHRLTIQALGNDGRVSEPKSYLFIIAGDNGEDYPLQILPWENENHEIEKLSILLRNDSESTKANKNVYALGEEVTYYLDFKNGGDDITEPVTLLLSLPLDFEIVDAGGGTVDLASRMIIWEYPEGMKKNFSGTRIAVLKYVAFSSENIDNETIYPLAYILTKGDIKDTSAVIHFIYKEQATMVDVLHLPYMYGDKDATTFRPDDTITRAEGALVLVRILFGQEAINTATITDRFQDIGETYEEAQKAISVATEYGIIIGYGDGTYKPNRTMTRAELMKILATYLSKSSIEKGIEGLQIKDETSMVKVYNNPVTEYIVNGSIVKKHWALNEVSLLYRLNMTPLNRNELDLRLDKGITRAEVAQLVNFYLLRAPAETNGIENAGFSDVSMTHQLIADIVEATRTAHSVMMTSDGKEGVI